MSPRKTRTERKLTLSGLSLPVQDLADLDSECSQGREWPVPRHSRSTWRHLSPTSRGILNPPEQDFREDVSRNSTNHFGADHSAGTPGRNLQPSYRTATCSVERGLENGAVPLHPTGAPRIQAEVDQLGIDVSDSPMLPYRRRALQAQSQVTAADPPHPTSPINSPI